MITPIEPNAILAIAMDLGCLMEGPKRSSCMNQCIQSEGIRTEDAHMHTEIMLEVMIRPNGVSNPNLALMPSCRINEVASTNIRKGHTITAIINEAATAPLLLRPATSSCIPVAATLMSMIARAGSHIQNLALGSASRLPIEMMMNAKYVSGRGKSHEDPTTEAAGRIDLPM